MRTAKISLHYILNLPQRLDLRTSNKDIALLFVARGKISENSQKKK